MKKQLLLLLFAGLFSIGGLNAQNVIPNPSVENWSPDTLFDMLGNPVIIEMPDDWISIQGLFSVIFGGTFNLAKTTDHHGTGSYGAVITPGLDSAGCDLINIFPYSSRPSKLQGFYKYQGTSNAPATVYVGMMKFNPLADTSEVIGGGFVVLNNFVSSYTQVDIPITFFVPDNPDTAVVYVDYVTGAPGVKLFVDDFSFGFAAGLDELALQEAFRIYPNPVSGDMTIELDREVMEEGFDQVFVMDNMGRVIMSYQLDDTHKTLDLSSLSKGLYLVRLTNGTEQTTRKVLKQ